VLHTVGLAGQVLVVVTPEPTSLTDAYATIKVLAGTQGRRQIRLLVNQVRRSGEGRAVRQQLQQVVDRYVNPTLDSPVRLELIGEVPADPAVREAVQRRQLLLELLPGTPPALALLQVAQRLVAP
jgi:flagellar biosynthesis protein FlhG